MKIIKNYIGYKDKKINKYDLDKFHKSINKIENHLAELEEKQIKKKDNIIDESDDEFKLSDELFRIGNKLEWILCEGCKRYYGLRSMGYIQRVSFDKSKNIEYLAKGDFGEVHKAIRFYHQDYQEGKNTQLKRYDKIVDILSKSFIVIIIITLNQK